MKKNLTYILILVGVIYLGVLIGNHSAPCVVHRTKAVVSGDSLRGDLANGTIVTVENGYYNCHEPDRGDIVAYQLAGREWPLVKVVRAIPGDTFALTKDLQGNFGISVNNAPIRTASKELYALAPERAKVLQLAERTHKGVIPANTYLIMGDIPSGSLDSSILGLASKEKLIGRIAR